MSWTSGLRAWSRCMYTLEPKMHPGRGDNEDLQGGITACLSNTQLDVDIALDLWKLGYFEEKEYGVEERGIVVGVIEPYLKLMRRLIKTYTLEPAGSHGVWGLDDHFFLPYIFGSAQLCPAVTADQLTPVEGSIRGAPQPSAVVKQDLVDMERDTNMYFSAVGFIYDVKQGPFWEHSPILFDISGIKDGWGKINKVGFSSNFILLGQVQLIMTKRMGRMYLQGS
ncbi:hypothetical protein KEM56_007342 [Ascosphaera pollenicola]|nr:hypothetical protein KEM56_007342 [Ascosphaera pollenicola]